MSLKKCQVKDCDMESFRTVDAALAKKVFTIEGNLNKVHLCKEHYREFKKGTKKERELQRANW